MAAMLTAAVVTAGVTSFAVLVVMVDMGMTMTTAFNVFARKAVREYRIPFEISGDVPNAETVEAIKEVKRMKADPSLGKTYSNVDQMMEELLADV